MVLGLMSAVGLLLLLPILYFLPIGLGIKEKGMIVFFTVLLVGLGHATVGFFQPWQMILILLLLTILFSYFLQKRFSSSAETVGISNDQVGELTVQHSVKEFLNEEVAYDNNIDLEKNVDKQQERHKLEDSTYSQSDDWVMEANHVNFEDAKMEESPPLPEPYLSDIEKLLYDLDDTEQYEFLSQKEVTTALLNGEIEEIPKESECEYDLKDDARLIEDFVMEQEHLLFPMVDDVSKEIIKNDGLSEIEYEVGEAHSEVGKF